MDIKQIKKITIPFLTVFLASYIMSGCGLQTAYSAGKDIYNTDTLTYQEEHEPLTIYTAGMDYSYFIDALNEVYPEVKLQVCSYDGGNSSGFMKQQLERGDIPDIYSTNYLQDEALQKEYLLDLSGYDFINDYSDTMLNRVDVDGNIYLLPSRYSVAGINYNKTMFEKYGWKVPESFEELNELVEQIKEEAPDITPVMARMGLKGYPFQYFFALGSTDFLGTPAGTKWKTDFLNGDATAVGNLESAAEYFQEWIDKGYIAVNDKSDSDVMSDFYDGKVAMVLGTATSRWTGVGKTTGETIEIGIMAWPGENGNHGMLLSNVARYYGINKELDEEGNEQKLEDALKVLSFMSTEEGQTALAAGSQNGAAFPFKNFKIEEDSPLYEVRDYIENGYTVPLVYEKYEKHFLIPMADSLTDMVSGKIDADELLAEFDMLYDEFKDNPEADAVGWADESFTAEQTAALSGMAMIDAMDADVSLVSLGGIYDDGYENSTGVQCGIYDGAVTEEIINIFRPYSNGIATVTLTGAEIKELYEKGREYVADPSAIGAQRPDGEEIVEYSMPYVLVVKDNAELDDNKEYKVVFSMGDYSDANEEKWGDGLNTTNDETSGTAIIKWIQSKPDRHFGTKDLEW
jgi:raffinose/stachyose/melibiose transport system substrate-binding protein